MDQHHGAGLPGAADGNPCGLTRALRPRPSSRPEIAMNRPPAVRAARHRGRLRCPRCCISRPTASACCIRLQLRRRPVSEGWLVQGPDGAFYGTTYAGGLHQQARCSGRRLRRFLDPAFVRRRGRPVAGFRPGADGRRFHGTTPQTAYCHGSICSGYGGTVFRMEPTARSRRCTRSRYARRDGSPPAGRWRRIVVRPDRAGRSGGGGTAFAIAIDGTSHRSPPSTAPMAASPTAT